MEKHIHGGVPNAAFERLNLPPRKTIDFSVNVSPLGPPRVLFKHWPELISEVLTYPSVNGDGIADYYMNRFGLSREHILPGNGSTECFYLVCRVLDIKDITIITPSFHDYERASVLSGANINRLPLSKDNEFGAPGNNLMTQYLEKSDALFLGNPNNPTNTFVNRDSILNLAETFPDKMFLVDEAFIQFLDDWETSTLLNPDLVRKNILVFHSLTKTYDIPGLRLGAVIGHPQLIQTLESQKEPWTVNGIAEKVASLMIDSHDYEEQLKKLIRRERTRFVEGLNGIKAIKLYPSVTNYMFAEWKGSDNLDDLLRVLLESGYHVRDCRNFQSLPGNFFRFCIRKKEDNVGLIDCLRNAATN